MWYTNVHAGKTHTPKTKPYQHGSLSDLNKDNRLTRTAEGSGAKNGRQLRAAEGRGRVVTVFPGKGTPTSYPIPQEQS